MDNQPDQQIVRKHRRPFLERNRDDVRAWRDLGRAEVCRTAPGVYEIRLRSDATKLGELRVPNSAIGEAWARALVVVVEAGFRPDSNTRKRHPRKQDRDAEGKPVRALPLR